MFLIVLGIATFLIGRDFAHAYLNVEETVSRRTSELSAANEQLRVLEQMKAKFFANVSHDFKTPITVAFAHLEELKRRFTGEDKDVTAAQRALNKLQNMVGELLDTVRAESGTLKMTWELASPGLLVRTWLLGYEKLCDQKNLQLRESIQVPDTLMVPMDVNKMERIFANLMSNALKFTREGGISVRVRHDESRLYVEVVDTGMGVPKEERERIFDRYYQAHNTTLREHGGSGIGLSFVKEMADLHHGSISVEDGDASGSRFIFAMPLSQDVEVTGAHAVTSQDMRVYTLKGSLDVPYPPARPNTVSPDRASVLLVEDNPEVAQVIHSSLEGTYNSFFARNGRDGLAILQEIEVDCIISDIMMPEMDGTEFLREVRKNPRLKQVPVMMLTSRGSTEDIVKHLKLGAQDYVPKPFVREELLARIHAHAQRYLLQKRLVAADKMVTLGTLSAGLAHEIKNPVHFARNYLNYIGKAIGKIREAIADDEENAKSAAEYLRKNEETLQTSYDGTSKALDRIQTIIQSMRGYSTGSQERTEINVTEALEEALTLLEHKRKLKDVEIDRYLEKNLKLLGYASLNQAFVNILDNALDAVAESGGRIEIEARRENPWVIVEIRDNGKGIHPDLLARIFDPFMTTKPPGEGTGLGLYITKDIVELQHGGRISVTSTTNEGTVFQLTLPREAPKPETTGTIPFHGKEMSVV